MEVLRAAIDVIDTYVCFYPGFCSLGHAFVGFFCVFFPIFIPVPIIYQLIGRYWGHFFSQVCHWLSGVRWFLLIGFANLFIRSS